MKTLLILADAQSVHTRKWAAYMASHGNFNTHVFSLQEPVDDWYQQQPITLHVSPMSTAFGKLGYLKAVKHLKTLINNIKPNIVHAHYATSYGMLGRKAGFHPYVISVWGSDVFDFPTKSILHRNILKRNLQAADLICSTSKAMAVQTARYTSKQIHVVPFGVDCSIFAPVSKNQSSEIVIGTVKTLEHTYGIDILIKAFAIIMKKHPAKKIRLKIAGQGSKLAFLNKLSVDLNIQNDVDFVGKIPHEKVPEFLNSLDVFVALSRNESFGVAVVEASACGCPVVVSNVGGIPEVVKHDETGYIVTAESVDAAADAIEKLVLDDELRYKFGLSGRKFIENDYNWEYNARSMVDLYHQLAGITS